jgi:hypothetical protein
VTVGLATCEFCYRSVLFWDLFKCCRDINQLCFSYSLCLGQSNEVPNLDHTLETLVSFFRTATTLTIKPATFALSTHVLRAKIWIALPLLGRHMYSN